MPPLALQGENLGRPDRKGPHSGPRGKLPARLADLTAGLSLLAIAEQVQIFSLNV